MIPYWATMFRLQGDIYYDCVHGPEVEAGAALQLGLDLYQVLQFVSGAKKEGC